MRAPETMSGHLRLRWARQWLWLALLLQPLWHARADAVPVSGAALPVLDRATLQALLPALRQGGYVFYVRHAKTRSDQEDHQPVRLEDCAQQRGLSDAGRHQARAIGQAFLHLQLPVGRVWSSPFCRCLETARLAFGGAVAQPLLAFLIGATPQEREQRSHWLREQLVSPPPAGENTVLVSHTANLEEVAGLWPKPEGAVVLIQPQPRPAGWRVVGIILPEVWSPLAAHAARGGIKK